ncbi:hypothetical protein BJ508DRAFT_304237 [Ascobolus immersus RN42]|uniref:F-box domain-containing protein n=1 Tax=Ascobolus immersus RN42 TaxID=1160509 RepID=A0A3N4ID72_ASCIM|nr:hypothetical protein BJ508DRAFT_304237 [Ascobolus immersus RN42]
MTSSKRSADQASFLAPEGTSSTRRKIDAGHADPSFSQPCQNPQQTSLLSLPNELLHEVTIHIPDLQTYISLARVNKRLNCITSTPCTRTGFAEHWFRRNFCPDNLVAPKLIEDIVRYVCFHYFNPTDLKVGAYKVEIVKNLKEYAYYCDHDPEFLAFLQEEENRTFNIQLENRLSGCPDSSNFVAKENFAPSAAASLAALLKGYTKDVPDEWFSGYLERLWGRQLFFWTRDRNDPFTMDNLELDFEEVVLGQKLLQGWYTRPTPKISKWTRLVKTLPANVNSELRIDLEKRNATRQAEVKHSCNQLHSIWSFRVL